MKTEETEQLLPCSEFDLRAATRVTDAELLNLAKEVWPGRQAPG